MAVFRTHVFGRIEDTSFTVERVSATVTQQPVQGRSRHTLVDQHPSYYCQVTLDMTAGQFIAFQDWYAHEINRGVEWFTAFLPLGGTGGYETCSCHFMGGYQAEVIEPARVRVTASWEVIT